VPGRKLPGGAFDGKAATICVLDELCTVKGVIPTFTKGVAPKLMPEITRSPCP